MKKYIFKMLGIMFIFCISTKLYAHDPATHMYIGSKTFDVWQNYDPDFYYHLTLASDTIRVRKYYYIGLTLPDMFDHQGGIRMLINKLYDIRDGAVWKFGGTYGPLYILDTTYNNVQNTITFIGQYPNGNLAKLREMVAYAKNHNFSALDKALIYGTYMHVVQDIYAGMILQPSRYGQGYNVESSLVPTDYLLYWPETYYEMFEGTFIDSWNFLFDVYRGWDSGLQCPAYGDFQFDFLCETTVPGEDAEPRAGWQDMDSLMGHPITPVEKFVEAAQGVGYGTPSLTYNRLKAFMHGWAIALYSMYGYKISLLNPDSIDLDNIDIGGIPAHPDWNWGDIKNYWNDLVSRYISGISGWTTPIDYFVGWILSTLVDIVVDLSCSYDLLDDHTNPYPWFFEHVEGIDTLWACVPDSAKTDTVTITYNTLRSEVAMWDTLGKPGAKRLNYRSTYDGEVQLATDSAFKADYKNCLLGQADYIDYTINGINAFNISRKAGLLGGMYRHDYLYSRQPGIIDIHFDTTGGKAEVSSVAYTPMEVSPTTSLTLHYDMFTFDNKTKLAAYAKKPDGTKVCIDSVVFNGEGRRIGNINIDPYQVLNDLNCNEVEFAFKVYVWECIDLSCGWHTSFDADYRWAYNNHPEINSNPLYQEWFKNGDPTRESGENPLQHPELYWPYVLPACYLFAPTNLTATPTSYHSINLSWADSSQFNTGYEIQYEPEGGTWTTITVGDVNSYTVDGLSPSTRYTFKVRATDGIHYSEWASASATTHPHLTSRDLFALGYNNGRKIAADPNDGTICLVHTDQGKVWYTESKDRGETWSEEICLGRGPSPCITTDGSGERWVAFQKEHPRKELYWTRSIDGINWTADSILVSGLPLEHPSISYNSYLEEALIAYGLRVYEYGYNFYYIYVAHIPSTTNTPSLDTLNPENDINRDILYDYPSVSVDLGSPFVLWQRISRIYRSDWNGSSWGAPYMVSHNDEYSSFPQAGIYNGVWETYNAIDTIYYGSEPVGGAITGWAHYPVVAEIDSQNVYVFWESDWDIYWNVKMNNQWRTPEKFTNTSARSAFPQIALSQDKKYLYVVWVEGDNVPYQIKFERVPNIYPTTIHSPVNNANIELGSSIKITWGSGPNNTTNNINFGEDVSYNIYWHDSLASTWVPIAKNVHDTMWNCNTLDIIPNNPEQLKLRVDAITQFGDTASDTININLGLYTANATALSYSNQRKVAVSGNTVHYVYTDGDSVFYAYFDGNYHKREFLGFGKNPAIVVDDNGVSVIWTKGNSVYYREKTSGWGSTSKIFQYEGSDISVSLSPPAFGIYKDTVKAVVDVEIDSFPNLYPQPKVYYVRYGEFPLSNPSETLWTDLAYYYKQAEYQVPLTSPSLTLDGEGNPHIVWTNPFWADTEEVYYIHKSNGEWSTAENLSNSPNIRSVHPFIDYNKGVINVVWKEGNNIVRRRRWIKGDWEDTETITTGGNAKISGSSIVLYQDNNIIKKSEWDKVNWQTPTSIDTGITPQTALSGNELTILYLKPAGSEYQLTLTQTTETFPWGYTNNTLATAPNNQRKVIIKDNHIHTVYDGYGKVYYRYTNKWKVGTENSELTDDEMSEDIVIGEGNNPAIASGDVLSFIYLKGDTLKYRYLSDTLSSEYTIEVGVSAPPAITGRDNRVFIGAPKGTDISLISVLYTDEGISEDIKGAVSGSHPALATDIMGNVHLAYQDNDTIYHKLWGDTIIDTIGEGTTPAINADGGMIDIAYQRGSVIYRRAEDLTIGEFNPEDSIGEGDNPQSYGFICGWNTTSGIVYKTWNGTEWEDGDILRGNYPQLRYIPGTTTYDVYIGKTEWNRVSGEWIKDISYPDKIPSLSATDSFGSGLNNAKRLISNGDTLYLAYTSNNNIYLTYSEDKGRNWHWPVLVDKGEYPAMAADSSRKEIYIAYLQGYYPNTGYRIKLAGYRSDLTSLYDTTYIIYEIPEEP